MSESSVSGNQHPFYQNKIAWLPIFLFSDGDERNSRKIAVRWLIFLICDSMAPQLSVDIGIDFNMAHFRLSVPYVNFYIRIPLPVKLNYFAHRNLWRVGARSKFKWMR